MGFTDIFKGKQYKAEKEALQKELDYTKTLMTPEMQDVVKLKKKQDELISSINNLCAKIDQQTEIISNKNQQITSLDKTIASKKAQIVWMDDEILVQDFGLYQPKYDFSNSDQYKERLTTIREQQKQSIKNGRAAIGNSNWTVNGSKALGKKMVKDTQKLLLRAFNTECDDCIGKCKYNNIESMENRIEKSRDALSKLGTAIANVYLSAEYYNLKIQELYLAFEYQQKKQEEKEEQKEARAAMREAAKLQKEIEAQRKKIEKEQSHYQKALITVMKQLEAADEVTKADLLEKKASLENELGVIETSLKDIDYREANQKAGYVYIISNIGAFGENIYKIGMTRRLDPQERIDELGDASVPFNFDVHAMIFSDNAPALENALHKAFESKKVNMVNHRREFFNVTLDEIKQVVRANYDKTVEFLDVPDAEQYRISQKMKMK